MSVDLQRNFTAAAAVTLMSVPQGIAYALIAGLPPVAGLYAAAIPAIVGAARSSRHVVAGPTNALSLLVGGAVLAGHLGENPVAAALTLALLVGALQLTAGLLRLGAVVDFISRAVVLGYITGAGLLIAFGQLGNITQTAMERGDPWTRLMSWSGGLAGTDPRSVALVVGTVVGMAVMRRYTPKIPATVGALGVGIVLSWLLDFRALGLAVVGDLAPVPQGFPPIALPSLEPELVWRLLPIALAATVLSLVESSSVARSIASSTGQRLDMNREFVGAGLANLAAGLAGGYPVSGSLSRSAVVHRMEADRWAGLLSGLMMLGVLLVLGPVVDLTPIASLAGLLLVVAYDLVDPTAIKTVMRSLLGDRLAFLGTLVGTWTLPLDTAIYLGVGISIVLFLRRVGHLKVRRIVPADGKLRESQVPGGCPHIAVVQIEGNLFFGAANELQDALDEAARPEAVQVVVVRMKRARGLDYTSAGVLIAAAHRLRDQGRHLVLAGMTESTLEQLTTLRVAEAVGPSNLFVTRSEWFVALTKALKHARSLVEHRDHGPCAMDAYLHIR